MSTAAPEAPPVLGRYVDLVLLGKGGMGAVYRARDPDLDRQVAIKVVLDSTPEFVERFRREAKAVAKLTHANIVQVYDFGVDDKGNPYFVMELVEGTAVDTLIRQKQRLTPAETVRVARQAAEGLAAAHRAGIIHRDIKPSNLIVDRLGVVKLLDFGIARVGENKAAVTSATAFIGTPGYMAPEQIEGTAIDHRADIYALGLSMFEMLTGAPPFQATNALGLAVHHINTPLPDLRTRHLGVPESLIRLIEQMSEKRAADRMGRCEAVIAALDEIAGQVTQPMEAAAPIATPAPIPAVLPSPTREEGVAPPVAASPTPVPTGEVPKGEDGPRGGAWLIGAGIMVAIVGTAGGFLWWRAREKPVMVVVPAAHDQAPPAVAGPPPTVPPTTAQPPGAAPTPGGVPKGEGPLRVAVLKFRNLGGDKALDQLCLGIGETAVSSMGAAAATVRLVERGDIESDIAEIDRVKDVHFDPASVAKMGKLEGIQVAVQGAFQKAGAKIRVTGRFIRVDTGEVLDTLTIDHPAGDVFGLQDAVARKLKEQVVALAAKR